MGCILIEISRRGKKPKDIIERLDLKEGRLFISKFDRPVIKYSIVSKDNFQTQVVKIY
jgi:superfamily II DNA helicase RecQ